MNDETRVIANAVAAGVWGMVRGNRTLEQFRDTLRVHGVLVEGEQLVAPAAAPVGGTEEGGLRYTLDEWDERIGQRTTENLPSRVRELVMAAHVEGWMGHEGGRDPEYLLRELSGDYGTETWMQEHHGPGYPAGATWVSDEDEEDEDEE